MQLVLNVLPVIAIQIKHKMCIQLFRSVQGKMQLFLEF